MQTSDRAVADRRAPLAPPLDDPVYQTLLACRAPDVVALRLAKAWPDDVAPRRSRVIQTHYKPFERARLVVELSGEGGEPGQRLLYLGVYASAERARRQHEAALMKPRAPSFGPPVTLLDDWRAVAWSLPNGPKLGSIDVCLDAPRFERLLAEHGVADPLLRPPRLLRYVPRKRALFRCETARGRALYLKFYRDRGADDAARNLALLASAGWLGFRVPALVFHDARVRAVAMDEVPGARLSDAIGAARHDAFERAGVALAGLHASALRPAAQWSAEGETLALRRAMADVSRALPAAAGWIDRLLGEIEQQRHRLAFEAAVPIHGNLFGDQMLVADDGIGIVDWDDLASGDPLYDLGRLIAHAIYAARARPARGARCAAALLRGYAASGPGPDPDRLRWHVATALLMRAKISALRPLSEDWIEDVGFAAGAAERTLYGDAPWR